MEIGSKKPVSTKQTIAVSTIACCPSSIVHYSLLPSLAVNNCSGIYGLLPVIALSTIASHRQYYST